MLPNVGWMEMTILFVIVLIIFGPKSLPKIGQALGNGIRQFKDAAKGLTDMQDDEPAPKPRPTASPQVVSQTPPTASTTTSETHTTEQNNV